MLNHFAFPTIERKNELKLQEWQGIIKRVINYNVENKNLLQSGKRIMNFETLITQLVITPQPDFKNQMKGNSLKP